MNSRLPAACSAALPLGADADSVPSAQRIAAWLGVWLQTCDSFYPTGGYAHSFGLEGLVQEGVVRDRGTLRDFVLAAVLPALSQSELPLAVQGIAGFARRDWERVGGLCVLSSALKSAQELRHASEKIGRQRVELLATLHHSVLAAEFIRRADAGAWPYSMALSAALEGEVLGLPREAVLSGMIYTTLAGVLSAAMKLLRLGQNASQSLLVEALAHAPALIAAAEKVPLDEIGWFNPWLDVAAARHESADARMFIS